MSQIKLFGSKRSGSRLAKNRQRVKAAYAGADGQSVAVQTAPAKTRNPFKPLAIVLACLLLIEILYFVAIFSNNAFISKWRTIYIETAMDTLSHKWLATSIIPDDIIQEVIAQRRTALEAQVGITSTWTKDPEPEQSDEESPVVIDAEVSVIPVETEADRQAQARAAFFELFYEVDEASMDAYLEAHPEALDNGWDGICINEAGLDDSGTDIRTIYDEQVLAIDVPNQILLVRVEGSGYIGVLAVAKDPALLTVQASSQLGVAGEAVGTIAEAHSGVLAMNGSGFDDPNGNGNGGLLAGYAMCDGVAYGKAHMGWGNKRLELHEDNLMYIKDAGDSVGEGTTDAVEFQPALIIDGSIVVDSNCGWTGIQPRACIGQSDKYEILMLVIEGRMPLRSVGTHVIECAEILSRHGCMQAMNLDGGASAIMWYDGEYITKCSNQNLSAGRPIPTAFVYARSE